MPFTHLHTHSHYSLLSALPKIDDLVDQARKLGMTSLALTDNGNLYGAIEFYKACKAEGLKPIIGVDFYVATRSRKDQQAGIDNRRSRLVLLAMNETGYKNLIQLVTLSHLEGFYYKPRIDRELLEKYNEGLIAISPSFSGEIATSLKSRNQDKAKEVAAFYKRVFPLGPTSSLRSDLKELAPRLYIEITRHPEIDGHETNMKSLLDFARKESIPVMAAHDVYYLKPEDRLARETLVRVNSHSDASDKISDSDEDDFSFISTERAEALFRDLPEALENTQKIVNACNFEMSLGKWAFPELKIESGRTPDDELKHIVFEGFSQRSIEQTPELVARAEYELKVIKDKGYAAYFLVVADMLRFARENGILSNIRGSVSGSLVTFLAGITNINPIEYEIPFERFLNPDRPSAPDIDMDFADNRRDEVIEYVRSKYGADKVAQIGTFGTMAARGSVRDVARAMRFPYDIGDRISKLIPMGAQGFPMTIKRALDEVPELKAAYENEEDTRRIIDMASKIEGCARHIGVHAAGVVISPTPLTDFTALQFDPKGEGKIITQYDMYSIDENGAGLLKFDFLGLKNLTIIADAIDRIKKIDGTELNADTIPVNDVATFEMLARGETTDLFQLNGDGMTRFLKDLKPTTIHDINAMVALYRPGPIQFIPVYIECKHDPSKVKYLDPMLKPILEKTYGVLVYQDDLLMIANKIAGYSWGEVDKFRKAIGKKIPAEMAAQKDKFISGCVTHSKWSEKKAKEVWRWIEPFAAYAFNKAHSVSYGRVAYLTAYLKAHFPAIYLSAVLSSEEGDVEKVGETIAECKRIGIPVLPPDVNESFSQFTVIKDSVVIPVKTGIQDQGYAKQDQELEKSSARRANPVANVLIRPFSKEDQDNKVLVVKSPFEKGGAQSETMAGGFLDSNKSSDQESSTDMDSLARGMNLLIHLRGNDTQKYRIRFGLVTIKNFGQNISTVIIDERKRAGKFKSLPDFLDRIKGRDLNKKSLESLIRAGALDCFDIDRGTLMANVDLMLSYNKENASRHADQDSLFGLMADHSSVPTLQLIEVPPMEVRDKLAGEKELLGLYISGHPLERFREAITKKDIDIKRALLNTKDGGSVILAVMIEQIRLIQTKKNETMAFITIADFSGSAEAVVFPRTYKEQTALIKPDICLAMKMTVGTRNGERSFVVERLKGL